MREKCVQGRETEGKLFTENENSFEKYRIIHLANASIQQRVKRHEKQFSRQ